MECGVLYARVIFDNNHRYSWLKYCHITNILPTNLRDELEIFTDYINSKYEDDIIVKMKPSIMPGCVTSPNKIDEISKDIYTKMQNIFKKLNIDDDCIRLVYGIGEIDEKSITQYINDLPSFEIIVEVARILDKKDKTGIIKI